MSRFPKSVELCCAAASSLVWFKGLCCMSYLPLSPTLCFLPVSSLLNYLIKTKMPPNLKEKTAEWTAMSVDFCCCCHSSSRSAIWLPDVPSVSLLPCLSPFWTRWVWAEGFQPICSWGWHQSQHLLFSAAAPPTELDRLETQKQRETFFVVLE